MSFTAFSSLGTASERTRRWRSFLRESGFFDTTSNLEPAFSDTATGFGAVGFETSGFEDLDCFGVAFFSIMSSAAVFFSETESAVANESFGSVVCHFLSVFTSIHKNA